MNYELRITNYEFGGLLSFLRFFVLSLILSGCVRGIPTERPPIHINPNMDNQPKFKAQSANEFFPDGAGMRPPIEGTVARGKLFEDDLFWRGLGPDGKPALTSPVRITEAGLKRGRERFNIYCSVCHGRAGDGQGIMLKKGYVPPPTFHSDLIRGYTDGQIFKTISEGVRNMPSYKGQIPAADRWLIVNYLRALQRSQNASLDDVPEDERAKLAEHRFEAPAVAPPPGGAAPAGRDTAAAQGAASGADTAKAGQQPTSGDTAKTDQPGDTTGKKQGK